MVVLDAMSPGPSSFLSDNQAVDSDREGLAKYPMREPSKASLIGHAMGPGEPASAPIIPTANTKINATISVASPTGCDFHHDVAQATARISAYRATAAGGHRRGHDCRSSVSMP